MKPWRSRHPMEETPPLKIICPHCKRKADKPAGTVNRARQIGAPIYCSRLCSGLGRRKWKSPAQKKEAKATYDAIRRAKLFRRIKAEKAEYHKRTYDSKAAAEKRRLTMPRHVEYCRQPKYKAYKAEYDRRRRAAEYGEFAEAYTLMLSIDRAVNARMSDYEVRVANGTINKTQQRKRAYATLISSSA